jgi:DNA helicase HerA-like ATPase
VLGLSQGQEASLGVVFRFARENQLPLVDIRDLRAVIQFLTGDQATAHAKDLGGLSAATAAVIQRQLTAVEEQGFDTFFGEPAFDAADLVRVASDGRGVVSCLELADAQDKPQLFSTCLMWLLAQLSRTPPEVGDADRPTLIFLLDEAHLLFANASKAFLVAVERTVRLIRSKGVGIFFITQTPKDVPAPILDQLGNRIQHALRAFTPADAKALKATVSTFRHSPYDLEKLLPDLGIGEAVVTELSVNGTPTPTVWTRLRVPQSRIGPADPDEMRTAVERSPLTAKYFAAASHESATETLARAGSLSQAAEPPMAAADIARVAKLPAAAHPVRRAPK